MTVRAVACNTRRKAFVVSFRGQAWTFPYSVCDPVPSGADPVVDFYIDPELGREGFTYRLLSGAEGSVLADHILDYHSDPSYVRDLLLYQLTVEAQKALETASVSRREIIRRMGTSAAQFYRLIDQTNYSKSVDQVLRLLYVLGREVSFTVSAKPR